MIWIIVCAVAFVVFTSFLVWLYIKHKDDAPMWVCGFTALIVFATFICLSAFGINNLSTYTNNEANLAEYEQLKLYYDVVNNSNDELLRWDYYQKCEKWNDKYESYLLARNSIWRAYTVGAHDFDNCDFIQLELRRK